jgi:dihydrofolate synthase/folylpolyglutamate synthase
LETTFFEATTVMALSHFANNKVDHAILETGLGGRLDSTTAAGASLTALTPISYDHMEILGATLTKIAGEKAAIMRRGVACVSVPQRPEVRAVLMQRASEVGAKLEFLDVSENRVYPAKLAGEHQMLNGQLAWRLAELALGAEFSPTRAMAALGKIRWPGRYQVVSTRPLTVYDVGHNPHGIKTFVETFRGEHSKGPKILVLALQADKNISHILDQLIGQFTTVIMTETGTRKFVAANELAEAFPDAKAAVYVECEPGKAVEMAQDQAGESGIIAILGSHYLGPTVAKSFKISFDKLY